MNHILKAVGMALMLSSCVAVQAMNPIQKNKIFLHSEAELNGYAKAYPVVVVFVSSASCGYCKMVAPFVDELSREMQHVLFVYIDYDNKSLEALANRYAPQGVPEIKILKNGIIVDQIGGVQSKETLRNLITRYAPAPLIQDVRPVLRPAIIQTAQANFLTPERFMPATPTHSLSDQRELERSISDLKVANADLDVANANLDVANADLDVANADLDVANADLDIANANLESANADLEAANADVQAAENF